MTEIKVSVIVPIYNVEKFITRCVDSLFEQTLSDVEFIFVDDATPDKSMDMLLHSIDNHPQCKDKVVILHHAENKGLPAARNTGLAVAKGEYIFHCDSDDFMDARMLEDLYQSAKEDGADIVWSDWYLSFANRERYMKQPSYSDVKETVRAMLSGVMKYNVWNKLVKRSLYVDNGVKFPDGYGMGEDMTMIMLFAYAKKVKYIHKAYYHYVKINSNAFSQTYSDKHLQELRFNVDRIIAFVERTFGNEFKKELAFMKLEAKFPFLLSGNQNKLDTWKKWYPEANAYIMQNKNLSLRSRLLQWCASKEYWSPVKLYSWIFNRIIYGIVYR